MICDNCLINLASTCSHEAKLVFDTLTQKGRMTRAQIQKETGLTYAITSKAINELENKLLIAHKIKGRSKEYWLTKIGARLIILSREGVKNK